MRWGLVWRRGGRPVAGGGRAGRHSSRIRPRARWRARLAAAASATSGTRAALTDPVPLPAPPSPWSTETPRVDAVRTGTGGPGAVAPFSGFSATGLPYARIGGGPDALVLFTGSELEHKPPS